LNAWRTAGSVSLKKRGRGFLLLVKLLVETNSLRILEAIRARTVTFFIAKKKKKKKKKKKREGVREKKKKTKKQKEK